MDYAKYWRSLGFWSFLGYLFAGFNICLFFVMIFEVRFSLVFFVLLVSFMVCGNLILSSLTSLYLDLQTNSSPRAKELFYLYGISTYLSFFLPPVAFLKMGGFLKGVTALAIFFLVGFFVWLYRILMIRRYTRLNLLNSAFATFFPHFIFFSLFLVFLSLAGFVAYVFIS